MKNNIIRYKEKIFTILIVDNKASNNFNIKLILTSQGYKVINRVHSYNSVINSINNIRPNLIILDVQLKDSIDGIEIAEKISIYNIPIFYLTFCIDQETIQRAIQTNPLAYIVKPFIKEELIATIKLIEYKLTNNNLIESEYINIGNNYSFDIKSKEIFFKNEKIYLTNKENILLYELVKAKGKIVSIQTLEYLIWNQPVSSSSLRVLVSRLRNKLNHKLIKTIPAIGCKLEII